MKKNEPTVNIINSDNDFFMVQNFILQLKAEKKLTSDAVVLYSFYRSLSGLSQIRCGYKYISANTGLSAGAVSKSNKLLVENKLISIQNHGEGITHTISVVPGITLPRRKLVSVYEAKKIYHTPSLSEEVEENCSPDEQGVHSVNENDENCSPDELRYKFNKNIGLIYNTTTGEKTELNPVQVKFIANFKKEWCERNQTKFYPKGDFHKILEIKDPKEALKLIPVLWTLDENDSWVRNSDHSMTIFVKEYKTGKLQSVYQNSWHFYQNR
jgi:hypothetical protein